MKNLRTEDEIIASWKGCLDEPMVSISCTAFNHESYIEDALKSFLSQETDFPFEILVHDDASTDRTPDIISEYEIKYPKIIKVIYQTENQYSKGVKIDPVFTFSRAKGVYIAICEGDDYWITIDKLQNQIDIMKQHPDINISFHPAYQVNRDVVNKNKVFCDYGRGIRIFTTEEVILGGGGFMPTASLVIKKEVIKELPDWFYKYALVGDIYLQIISSITGGALYIPVYGSIYRQNIEGSWSSKQKNVAREFIKQRADSFEKCFIALDESYNGYYKDFLYSAIANELVACSIIALKNGYFDLSKEILAKSLDYKKNVNKNQSILNYFKSYPKLLRVLIILRGKFK